MLLPIAAEIASRLTRDQAHSALPDARRVADRATPARVALPRPRRSAVGVLRRLAALSGRLADRLERPVTAE